MSKLTKYTAPIASIDSMGFPLQTERTVYLASDVDAHLATQREEIERLTVDLDAAREAEEFLRDTPWLQENATLKAERATLQAELEAMTRKRDLLKNAYDVLSTDSDELLSRNTRLEQQLAALQQERAAIEQAISVEFTKKVYTDEDRQHKDLLENLGTFLDHHQELEQQLAAREGQCDESEQRNENYRQKLHLRDERVKELEEALVKVCDLTCMNADMDKRDEIVGIIKQALKPSA